MHEKSKKVFNAVDLQGMAKVAAHIADLLKPDMLISLQGDLGAGKTTLVQLILQQLGYHGRVKSPTYTLIEEYQFNNWHIVHLDLYRIADPEELEYLAIDEFFSQPCVKFIEWYQQAQGYLPPPDFIIQIDYQQEKRKITIIHQKPSKQGDCVRNHPQSFFLTWL